MLTYLLTFLFEKCLRERKLIMKYLYFKLLTDLITIDIFYQALKTSMYPPLNLAILMYSQKQRIRSTTRPESGKSPEI